LWKGGASGAVLNHFKSKHSVSFLRKQESMVHFAQFVQEDYGFADRFLLKQE
jgi:hypothetical protein